MDNEDFIKMEEVKNYYYSLRRKPIQDYYFSQLVDEINDSDKEQFKLFLTKKIKDLIIEKTDNGKSFQTESVVHTNKHYPEEELNKFKNAIISTNINLSRQIWECPQSFATIIKNMSYDELNNIYDYCLTRQQKLLLHYSKSSKNANSMLFDYYNRDIIENIEILQPLLSFDIAFQTKMNVVGGNSFWGRKNIALSSEANEELLKTIAFYKNLLLAIDTNVCCNIDFGFFNITNNVANEDIDNLANYLTQNNPNICEYQNEFILRTEKVDSMIENNKRKLQTILIDENNKFEIYEDFYKTSMFVIQYKTTPNNFSNKVNNSTNATKCEIILFYLPDKTINSAFQLCRLDMYSEINFHRPYGKEKIDTIAHIHTYSIEDAALNTKFDKDHKEKNLAHYDRLRNLPPLATYSEYETYFKNLCGLRHLHYEPFYKNEINQ